MASTDRWARIESLYHAAIALAPSDRAAFLARECGADTALRAELTSLLAQGSGDGLAGGSAVRAVAAAAAGTLRVAEQIGSYTIVAPLGAGGMGEVFRAKDTKLGRDVALKVLPASFTNDPERVARFRREAQVLASLNHPHIAQIHGLDEANGVQFLVLELVDGESLDKWIARGAIRRNDALRIAKQIAEALGAAHDKGIIHRDLKPANVALTSDGQVKVLDFGLAKAVDSSDGLGEAPNSPTITSPTMMSGMGIILGTAAYMSPEQATGRAADKRSDIWSFGCLLYEMLTGKRAFVGDGSSDTLAAVLTTEPDWTALPPGIPGAVRQMLRRCLRKDPRQRLSAIQDARLELDERDAVDVDASARGRFILAAWLAGAGLLTLGSVAAVTGFHFRSHAAAVGEVTRFSITLPTGVDILHESTSAVISPDGRMVVIVAGDQWWHPTDLWVRPLEALTARRLADTHGARFPFWSPDSRHIGFFADQKLKTVDVENGNVQELCPAPEARGGAWNRDDVILFAPANAGPLLRIAASGGTPIPVVAASEPQRGRGYRFPQFLPDSDHFLAAVTPLHNGAYDIVVGSLSGGAPIVLMSAETTPVFSASASSLLFMRKGSLVAQGLDASRRALTGDPVPIAESTGYFRSYDAEPTVSVSASGSMSYTGPMTASSRVVIFDQTGRTIRTLDVPPGNYYRIAVTRDGRRAALIRTVSPVAMDLWMVDLDKPGLSLLTDAPRLMEGVVWSADGERVAYSSTRDGPRDIFERSLADRTEHLLYRSTTFASDPFSWSPDGQYLLVSEQDPVTGRDIQVVPAAGQTEQAWSYLHTPFNEVAPQISPNGRWLAYSSDKTGQYELYIDAFPKPRGEVRVSSSAAVGAWWGADSHELLFTSTDRTELLMAEVRDDATLLTSAPNVVGHLPKGVVYLSVTGDLQRIVALVDDTAAVPVTIVEHWPALLAKH